VFAACLNNNKAHNHKNTILKIHGFKEREQKRKGKKS
jgi:hypothetical protein